MRMRKPHGQSEHPSLEPLFPALLQLELPEMETGKEVAVRSVSPFLQVQDDEERVTPTANSLEVKGDVGMEKQLEKLEKRMILHRPCEIGEPQGARILPPLLIEESKSDSELPTLIPPSKAPKGSELPTWIPPSEPPKGSLLHTLYFLLSGAGSDGIRARELFKCLEELSFERDWPGDWKVQVRRHLKTNRQYFCEAKGYWHCLVCHDQLDGQKPKSNPATIASTSLCKRASSSKTDLSGQPSTPATAQTGSSVDTYERIVRRKAYQKANAALSQQATMEFEFEELYQSMDDMQMLSSVADPTGSQLVSHGRPSTSSRKRKSPSSHDEKLTHHHHPIPGGMQATEAETFAKMEVQTGQTCIAEKDETGNWRCAMMAMAGYTVCYHHRSLQSLQEDGETSLSPNPGSPKYLTASKPRIAQDSGGQSRVQCIHRHKSRDGTRISQCSRIAMEDHRLCERHKQLREERQARERADAQQGKQRATSIQQKPDSSIAGLPESHRILDRRSLSLHRKSATISPQISREDTPRHLEAAKNFDKPATGVSNHVDDSNAERLQLQMPKNVPKRHYVAARKTASNVGPLKSQGPIRAPTTPPLPPAYGIRRKAPVKNIQRAD